MSAAHVPERTCVACRGKAPRAQLLRLVLATSGELVVDARAVMPGRGAWIHPDPRCVDLAERRRALGRALRTTGSPDVTPVRDWLASHAGLAPERSDPGPVRAGITDCKGG